MTARAPSGAPSLLGPQGLFPTILPRDVVTRHWASERGDAPLVPAEAHVVARAVPRRRREFAAGRACAREALGVLGVRDFALLPGAGRAPAWPAGVVGSLTHTDGYCAAAVARRGCVRSLGIDVEVAGPLPPRLLARIASPLEREALAALGGPNTPFAKILFSAKESVFKCWYPIARRYLDFTDVAVELRPEGSEFVARFSERDAEILGRRRLVGRFACSPRHVFTAVVLRPAWSCPDPSGNRP